MRPIVAAGILVLLLPCLAGCLWTPELSGIQREIERQLPGAHFEKDVRLSLGPLSLGMARFATGFIPEAMAPEAREHTSTSRKCDAYSWRPTRPWRCRRCRRCACRST